MNKFLGALKNETNYAFTENGAVTHKTTKSDLLDMFAMGGAYRTRSDEDVILLFKNAYEENPMYALRCLFYLRDCRGGQGERRFFKVCMKWLANNDSAAVIRNLEQVPEFGRWDDLFVLFGTKVEKAALEMIKYQLALDVQCKAPSLLGKWMPSENASSVKTQKNGNIIRQYLNMSHKEYRQMLTVLRTRINVLEKLMSENRWDEIEFDKIPSRAGMIYRNAFARRDILKQKYEAFAKDTTTKVNAKTLYPYECVSEAAKLMCGSSYGWNYFKKVVSLDDTNRLMVNKYWDNLADYFNGANFNALAVVDTSGSMTGSEASAPINVAISLGLYCAEKAKGPFAGHYVSFSSRPQLIKTEGVDFCDKVERIYRTNLCENTNIEATFDMLLNTAKANHCIQDDLPQNIIIISDMEFDCARGYYGYEKGCNRETLMEGIARKWAAAGYEMPHLIYWNVQARQNNIPMLGNGRISFVSGFSPSIFETIMSGKTGYELMMEKLNSERYSVIK